jgi:DNA repair ATPase RecN
MTENKLKSLGTGKIVSIVLIAALIAMVVFLIVQNMGLKSQVDESQDTAESLTAEIENVEKRLNEYEYVLNEKDLDVEKKQQMLNERDSLIQSKDLKINDLLRRNKISQQEAETLRGRMEQLEHYVKKYQGQIDVLKQELVLKNEEIDSLKTVIGGTQDSLRQTIDRTTVQGIKLRAASKLNAHTFAFFRYKQSGAAVQESEFRASQLDLLKICMDLGENAATKAGEKMVYLQIKDAKGNLVKDEAKSGFFKYEDAHIPYSVMTKVEYEKQATKVCVDFSQPTGHRYAEGKYTVQAYCDNFEIGHSEFTVR